MQSLLDPAVFFFALGVFAGLVRSNLEMPAAISVLVDLPADGAGPEGRLCAGCLGLHRQRGQQPGAGGAAGRGGALLGYALLRRMLSGFNAAAVAATYGSVSAVTFVTATQYLESQSVPYGGYMAAAMALMESPAIILAVMLASALRQRQAVPATHAAQMVAMSPPVQPPAPPGQPGCLRLCHCGQGWAASVGGQDPA